MNEFDEYIKDKYPSDYLLMTVRYPDQELCELYSDQFEVWQHRQAKIDELQARIDEALNTLCKLQYSSGERIYSEVGNILKGDKDD